MPLFNDAERGIAEAIAALNYTNPFTPERISLEKTILKDHYREKGVVWSTKAQPDFKDANVPRIQVITEKLAITARRRLTEKRLKLSTHELETYENLIVYYLFEEFRQEMVEAVLSAPEPRSFRFYNRFLELYTHYMQIPGYAFSGRHDALRTFEIYFQIHRAFYYIFDFIIGSSNASGKLRASIWQSIFTHDIYRYNRALYDRMRNITTLITGPSGTGKELVARAISLSQYIPFHEKSFTFDIPFHEQFHPLHLSAMPQTLIESELFGHCKGAFTGAVNERAGWLETCSKYGTVFLDEIGEINEEIQVKLLRILQDRRFQRLGEHNDRLFQGKILAATNRNLSKEISNNSFRMDLYYRLCSDMVTTPSLKAILAGSESELSSFTAFIANKLIGPEEADELTDEAVKWIRSNLGLEYDWPGNVRELEQCVRNILIRGGYTPQAKTAKISEMDKIYETVRTRNITADELLNGYCAAVYNATGSYTETADTLGLDRRTVKKRVIDAGMEM